MNLKKLDTIKTPESGKKNYLIRKSICQVKRTMVSL